MNIAWADAQAVRRSVKHQLRRTTLPVGDVVALDSLVDDCLVSIRTSRGAAFGPVELLSDKAVSTFITSFEEAVRQISGNAFDEPLRSVARALEEMPVRPTFGTRSHEQLDDVDVVIEVWIERIAANDRATAVHSRAVGAWSHRVASKLGLGEDLVAHITRCGTIHDIGKMMTPRNILVAPRTLTAHEWGVMQRHVIDGWNIVADEALLLPFSAAVRGHHERFDGLGYPDRLSAHKIDLSARIVTVADAFNAMIADRPYRQPMSPLVAITELEKQRGAQFDPECVDAMIGVVLGN